MCPLLAYTLCPEHGTPTKNEILNILLYNLAESAHKAFQLARIKNVMNIAYRDYYYTLYQVEIQVMDDLYKIKYK